MPNDGSGSSGKSFSQRKLEEERNKQAKAKVLAATKAAQEKDLARKRVASATVLAATKQAQEKFARQQSASSSGLGSTAGGSDGYGSADPYAVAASQIVEANLQNATEEEVIAWIEANYSPAQSSLLRVPELRDALLKAARENMTPQRAMVEIEKTQWWQQRSESERTYDVLSYTDPSEFNARVDERMYEIIPEWDAYGVDGDIRQTAIDSLRLGYNDDQIRIIMAEKLQQESSRDGLDVTSRGAADANELMRIARQEYLTPIDRQTAERWAIKAIRQGADVESEWRSYLASITASKFGVDPTSGVVPADILAPVKSAIAEALEMSADSIDLLSPQYSGVMSYDDGKTIRPMTAYEALAWARKQPGYAGTKGAVEESVRLSQGIAKAFGGVA